ncbi:hypothetical protein GKE73_01740 [Paludibacterium sp. dN 18-1]|uniref:Uncharacterized protein n=2 Tax=Paludibacterium denitrificans TaxID=2675226 RepID=A0A844G841_9NEIS|nr:hypothetical protein [Paludibacterium denitrificans]
MVFRGTQSLSGRGGAGTEPLAGCTARRLSHVVCRPDAFPLPDSEMQQRVEGSLLASASLWQAQADTQRDLLLTSEKWLADYYRVLLGRLAEAGHHPSMDVLRQALQVGYQSGSAFNKVSRRVGHFAATNFSTAPLNAARDMRKVWKQQKP